MIFFLKRLIFKKKTLKLMLIYNNYKIKLNFGTDLNVKCTSHLKKSKAVYCKRFC